MRYCNHHFFSVASPLPPQLSSLFVAREQAAMSSLPSTTSLLDEFLLSDDYVKGGDNGGSMSRSPSGTTSPAGGMDGVALLGDGEIAVRIARRLAAREVQTWVLLAPLMTEVAVKCVVGAVPAAADDTIEETLDEALLSFWR